MAQGAAQQDPFSGYSGAITNYMNMMQNPWMMGLSGLGGLFGGLMGQSGANQMSGDLQQAMSQMKQYGDQGLGFLSPYQQAGVGALGNFASFNQNYANPTQAYNNIMGNYQMTPAAQFQMQQMNKNMQNQQAAGGITGSPAAMKDMNQYDQGLVSQDQQQYLQNVLGIGNTYTNNLSQMMGEGLGAAQGMNQNRMQLGGDLSQLYQNMGMAGMYGNQAMGSGIGSLLGGLGGIASQIPGLSSIF